MDASIMKHAKMMQVLHLMQTIQQMHRTKLIVRINKLFLSDFNFQQL